MTTRILAVLGLAKLHYFVVLGLLALLLGLTHTLLHYEHTHALDPMVCWREPNAALPEGYEVLYGHVSRMPHNAVVLDPAACNEK